MILAAIVASAAVAVGGLVVAQRLNSHPGNRYYVAADGDDSHAGTDRRPLRTIQAALDAAPSGATVLVGAGEYGPFTVTRPDVTVSGRDGEKVTVLGSRDTRDVILLAADNVTVRNLTVTGCRPDPGPAGFEKNGSSSVRIDNGTTGVRITGLAISDGRGSNDAGLPFGCFGVMIQNATKATVEKTDISGHGYGVFAKDSRDVEILDNTIHDNDTIIRNTPTVPDEDFGGTGIGFAATTGAVARGNRLYDNGGPSTDFGFDGGAFEIYQSSRIHIEGNDIEANENILETGTGPGGECADNKFTGNRATGHRPGARLERTLGIILRCARAMVITGNRLGDTDEWMFYLTGGDAFSSSLAGLTIRDNEVRQGASVVYAVDLDPAQWSPDIDANSYGYAGDFARGWDRMPVPTLADWKTLTGLDRTSIQIPR